MRVSEIIPDMLPIIETGDMALTIPHRIGRIILAENTDLQRMLDISKEHNWTLYLDPHNNSVVHFTRRHGSDNVVLTCFFGIGPFDPIVNASVWVDSHTYGDGQIWIPIVLFKVESYTAIFHLLKSDDPRNEKDNV